MSWWSKQLEATVADVDSIKALNESKKALAQAQLLRAQVESVSSSLGGEIATNHFSMRMSIAYGLPGKD